MELKSNTNHFLLKLPSKFALAMRGKIYCNFHNKNVQDCIQHKKKTPQKAGNFLGSKHSRIFINNYPRIRAKSNGSARFQFAKYPLNQMQAVKKPVPTKAAI